MSKQNNMSLSPFLKPFFFALLCLLIFTSGAAAKNAPPESDLFELDLESLMNIEVVTASKKLQSASSSPLPVVVITDSQIRLSGSRNIPDLLRRVAGADVLSVSASDHNVSLRGFNQDSSGKLLVLIDGRTVFLDFYGIVLWDSLPVSMEEIKRIEIVKGPGSSIHGGNAYLGVINIITKEPRELDRNLVMAAGEYKTYGGSMIYGIEEGAYSYKLAINHKEYEEWHDDGLRYSTGGNFSLGKVLSRGESLKLTGSLVESKGETFTSLDNFIRESRQGHLLIAFEGRNDLNVKAFWNGLDTTVTGESVLPAGVPLVFNESAYDIKTDTYELEITRLFKTGFAGDLLFGGNYRFNKLRSEMFGGSHSQDLYGLFLEDEVSLFSKASFTAGLRYDHHPLTEGHFSPRLGLVYKLKENHDLRFSYATAYRLPTFTQSYLYVERKPPLFSMPLTGNEDLDVEEIRSWNLGYSGLFMESLDFRIDLFRSKLKDFIRWPEDTTVDNTYRNRDSYETLGGEVSFRIKATEKLNIILNYAYLHIEDTEREEDFKESPRKKFNAGMEYESERIFGSIFIHHVGATRWSSYKSSLNIPYYDFEEKIDAYTIVNMNVGVKVSRGLEASVNAYNLFDKKYREFCMGDEFGRKVDGKLSYVY